MHRSLRFILLTAIAMAIACALGCTEENVTYVNDTSGVVYGRVASSEDGILIQVWQSKLIKQVSADDDGYFAVTELPAGMYEVRIDAPSGQRKIFRNVDVDAETPVDLGVVELSMLKWPLIAHSPRDGDEGVFVYTTGVSLRSEERINSASLEEDITISPPVEGSWRDSYSYYDFSYEFFAREPFKSGTKYTVTIDKSLKFVSGAELGEDYSYSFTTQSFAVSQFDFSTPQWSMPPTNRNLMLIVFNVPVDSVNLLSHITVDPPLELGFQIGRQYYDQSARFVQVTSKSALRLGTTYTLTVKPSLRAEDGSTLGTAKQVGFQVEPLRVTGFSIRSSYSSNDTLIDPVPLLQSSFTFNTPVNLDSLNAALSFSPPIEGLWYRYQGYSSVEEYRFFYTSNEALPPDQAFTLTLNGAIALAGDVGMGGNWVHKFRTRPVTVTEFSPSAGTRFVGIGSPVSVYFNVPMDHPSTEAAFKVTTLAGTPVEGRYEWDSDFRVRFWPLTSFAPGQFYSASVETDAVSKSGVHLKEEASTFFQVSE